MAKKKKTTLRIVSDLDTGQVKSIDRWISPYDTDKNVDWKKTTLWKVTSEGERGFVILRYIRLKDKTSIKERFDRKLYDFQKDKKDECEEICRILNYRIESKLKSREAWKIKSEFLKIAGSELSQKFYVYMFARSENARHARQCVNLVETHFLKYFYQERKPHLYDYLEWHSQKTQSEYIEYIFNKKVISKKIQEPHLLSSKTIKHIIQYINHFMNFIHIESNGHVPKLVFTFPSVTPARYISHDSKRREAITGTILPRHEQYIDNETYELIYNTAPDNLKSAIWLSYHFGLRRSEVLGLELEDVRQTFLKVNFQLLGVKHEREDDGEWKDGKKIQTTVLTKRKGPLKNRKPEGRKVPYWNAKAKNTYEHIKELHILHPSGLTEMWGELMDRLGLQYEFKHLRNAFISNALRDSVKLKIGPTDVQLAVGHEDIRTTMIYLRDFRDLDENEESWTPETA